MSYKSLQYYSQLRDAASGVHHYGQAAIWGASTKAENSGDVKREHIPQHRPTPGQGQQRCWLLTGGAAQYEALGYHEVSVSQPNSSSDCSYLQRIHLLSCESCQHEDLLEAWPALPVF